MKLEYTALIENSSFILTNFKCAPAQQLLKDKGLYKIIWTRDKGCDVIVDGYKIALSKDQVLFCTTLNVLEISKNCGIIAIVFNREFYCIRDHDHEVSCNGMLFFGSWQPPLISLHDKEVQSFETIFSIFKEEFETKDDIQGEMLRVMLKRLLIKSTRLVEKSRGIQEIPSSQMEIVRKFHILVENNFREKHKVSEYAEMLYKSPKTISNVFNKSGHSSPLHIINERIMLEAKRLLKFSEKTAEQIAYELGYAEGAHFSKFFKSHCGLPPVEYRAQNIKKIKPPR